MKNHIKYFFTILFSSLSVVSCTEPYKLETNLFKDALVIESTITNELDNQKVKITHIYRLENNEPSMENNAQVWIEDGNHNSYHFSENEPGVYISDNVFKAIPNVSYKLFITTSEGKRYESREEYLPPEAEIKNLYAEKETIQGGFGIQVYIDSNEDLGDAKYFRYEYEETFKIITPFTITENIELVNINTSPSSFSYDVFVSPSEEEKQVGYSTNSQEKIIQTSTISFSENNIIKFPVRFMDMNNYALRERYSILVKQYVQSYDSYDFYKTINDLGSIESLLIENQPGYVRGNIYSVNDNKEKVVGFFDVSYISKKRIYFNYADFNLHQPEYPYRCQIDTLDYTDNTTSDFDRNDRTTMYSSLILKTPPCELLSVSYYEALDADGNIILIPLYILLTAECGNCTSFSSNIKPAFWED